MLGENPSYYAQLEILAKRILQSPTFYANLYDKPENVKRISASLKAIELMIDRAIYESRLRQEAITSVLVTADPKMEDEYERVQNLLNTAGPE